jgi:hypothetical protein
MGALDKKAERAKKKLKFNREDQEVINVDQSSEDEENEIPTKSQKNKGV